VGRLTPIAGTLASIGPAYLATLYNNIMDLLQLVFGFVNAPLFATFLLGMFWKRTTGHGAFWGLVAGTVGAAAHHGLTLARGSVPGVKGGYFATLHLYRSELAQTFWTATAAFTTCLLVSVAISLATRPRPEHELRGLVYSLTPRPADDSRRWIERPAVLAVVVLGMTLLLNVVFY
jgi:SSS family solute:Na+ symporter